MNITNKQIEKEINESIYSFYGYNTLTLYNNLNKYKNNKNKDKVINRFLCVGSNNTNTFSKEYQIVRYFIEMIVLNQGWDYFFYRYKSLIRSIK